MNVVEQSSAKSVVHHLISCASYAWQQKRRKNGKKTKKKNHGRNNNITHRRKQVRNKKRTQKLKKFENEISLAPIKNIERSNAPKVYRVPEEWMLYKEDETVTSSKLLVGLKNDMSRRS